MLEYESYPNFKKFQKKNILSIDYGQNVIGLATFMPGVTPFVLGCEKIINKSRPYFLEQLSNIIQNELIEVIIFGVPYFTDGKETNKTKEHQRIISEMKEIYKNITFYEQDETLTTVEAKERMLNSPKYNFKINMKKLDELCAIIILENFIMKIP